MPQRVEETFTGHMGYNDTAAPDQLEGYMAPGSAALYPEGNGRLSALGSPLATGIRGALHATVIANDHGGIDGSGSVVAYRSSPAAGQDCTLYVGSGSVIRNGSVIATATNRMQMKPAGTPFELGLTPPSTPTAVAVATGGTKLDGSYALAATVRRSITNGESNPSPRTAPIVVAAGGRIKVTIPAQASFDVGVDQYRVYATIANFATVGVLYFYKDFKYGVDVAVGGGDVFLDYYDGDLLGIASPTSYFKPPDCTHLFTLGGYVMAAGAYPVGGWGIAPSILNQPDAYDPDTVIFLNPGAPITGCTGRAGDGFQYIACRDSLHGCILTGDPSAPVLARVLWGNDGFVSDNNFCYVDTELYGQSSARGPVRTQQGAEPDRSFAQQVLRTLEAMGPSAVVGYDPYSNQVVYAAGTTAIAYLRNTESWSAPITLPSAVQSKVTVGGKLYLVCSAALYEWGRGAVGTWTFLPFRNNHGGHHCTVTNLEVDATADVNVSIVTGLNGTVAMGPQSVPLSDGHSGWVQVNVTDCRSYAPKLTGSGAVSIYRINAEVLVHGHRG